MKKLFFSIILPVFNREKLIAGAIDSVLNQEFTEYELIIIDDGSTDKTPEILEVYKFHNKVKLITQPNQGVCVARNLGMKYAAGQYVLFLDSDDRLEKGILSTLAKRIEKEKYIDCICFGYSSTSGQIWTPYLNTSDSVYSNSELITLILSTHLHLQNESNFYVQNYIWNKAFNLDFLKRNDIKFNENRNLMEDGRFIIQVLMAEPKLITISDIGYVVNRNTDYSHLSSSIDPMSIVHYVSDEDYYETKLKEKFDFSNSYYLCWNLSILISLLQRINWGKFSNFRMILPSIKHSKLFNKIINNRLNLPIKQKFFVYLLKGDLKKQLVLYLLIIGKRKMKNK